MSDLVKTLANGLDILEALFSRDFQGKTVREIREITGLDELAIRRALHTLRERAWVVEAKIAGSKETRWMVAEKLTMVSSAYRRHALRQLKGLVDQYRTITGEDLPR